jgi:uncharacterized protein (DUF1778 family)
MSEYESLREDIAGIFSAFDLHATVQRRFNDAVTVQHERLWTEVAELRDEVNAVANRLESLTHFVTTDPAEVAAKIVNDANRVTLKEVRDGD